MFLKVMIYVKGKCGMVFYKWNNDLIKRGIGNSKRKRLCGSGTVQHSIFHFGPRVAEGGCSGRPSSWGMVENLPPSTGSKKGRVRRATDHRPYVFGNSENPQNFL